MRILRLPELHKFIVLTFMFKYKNNLLPTVFKDFYHENKDYHRYPTRGRNLLRTPRVKSQTASNFIKNTGVSLWNDFSPHITQNSKFGLFKKEIINLLIADYSVP